MIACDGACIPDGGVHAPLLCPNIVASGWGARLQDGGGRLFKTKCYACTECNISTVSGEGFEGCAGGCSVSHS